MSPIDIFMIYLCVVAIVLFILYCVAFLLALVEHIRLSRMSDMEQCAYLIDKYGYHWQEHLS